MQYNNPGKNKYKMFVAKSKLFVYFELNNIYYNNINTGNLVQVYYHRHLCIWCTYRTFPVSCYKNNK